MLYKEVHEARGGSCLLSQLVTELLMSFSSKERSTAINSMTLAAAVLTPVLPIAVVVRVSSPLAVVAVLPGGGLTRGGQGQKWDRVWAWIRVCLIGSIVVTTSLWLALLVYRGLVIPTARRS
ncbi:hypothetical protein Pcinc_004809 [Petrolisthes cinctipes]|uniref:Uncharacterized protein n=1 Tax=Petrolisthes cinctipes TaxID=88211 RepID=A0AAE1KZY5_PETCI|nr:hypothetical protein Pcinc_004809 [Petrolisthes cinctipes]